MLDIIISHYIKRLPKRRRFSFAHFQEDTMAKKIGVLLALEVIKIVTQQGKGLIRRKSGNSL